MRFDEYIKLAVRTESRINPKTGVGFTRDERLLHAAIGMVTEVGELLDAIKKHIFYGKQLDRVNMQEEIGDLCWYVALASDVLNITPEAVIRGSADVFCQVISIVHVSANCLVFVHNEVAVVNALSDIMGSIFTICEVKSFSLGDILDTNIAKLKARYPDKFDTDKALNRDLKLERKILEK